MRKGLWRYVAACAIAGSVVATACERVPSFTNVNNNYNNNGQGDSSNHNGSQSVTSVVVTPHNLTLGQSGSGILHALVTTTGNAPNTVVWSTSNEGCARVVPQTIAVQPADGWSASVIVTSNSNCSAWIKAVSTFDPSKKDSALVSVNVSTTGGTPVPASVQIMPQGPTIQLSGSGGNCSASITSSAPLVATVYGSDGNAMNVPLTWTVSGGAVITPIGSGDKATLLVNATAPVDVVVTTKVNGTNLVATDTVHAVGSCSPTTHTVNIPQNDVTQTNCTGYTTSVTYTVNVDGQPYSGATWTTSNAAVATVSNTGVVSITGGVGTATITAQTPSGNGTRTITTQQCPNQNHTVTIPQGDVTVNACSGYTTSYQLNVNVDNVQYNGATWTSSNTSVATVNSSGLVTLVQGAIGSAVITAQTPSGNATRNFTVNTCPITAHVDSVVWSPKSATLTVGGPTATFHVTVYGSPGISQAITNPTNSQTGCAQITNFNSATNDVTVQALTGCTAPAVLSATSVADNTKSGSASVTTTSGNLVCTASNAGTGAAIASGSTVTGPASGQSDLMVNVSCTNQFGNSFLPFGRTNHAEIGTITGTTTTNYNGANFTAGSPFRIHRISSGSALYTIQAAVLDQTVLTSFTVNFP